MINDKKISPPQIWQRVVIFVMFAQHGHTLTGVSPQAALITGRLQPKTGVSVVTRNLKEVGGKHLL